MRLLRCTHLYAGLLVALPLLLMCLSGVALVFKDDAWRWRHPQLAGVGPKTDAGHHAHAVECMRARFDAGIELVKWPQEGLWAYHLWLADGTEALVDPATLETIDRWAWWQRPTAVLAELHVHLMAGELGARVVGYLGLAGLVMLASGVGVWWPARRRFRWRQLWPGSASAARLLISHRNLGAVLAAPALILVASGTGVAFFEPTRALLNGVFGDAAGPPLAAKPEAPGEPGRALALAELLARAEQVLPAGRITFVYPDRARTGVLTLRKRLPSEPHPNGLSFIHLDRSDGALLALTDASQAQPGDRIANWMYPLHSGKWGGRVWQAVVALHGALLAVLMVAGVLAWLRRPRAARPAPQRPRTR